MRRNPPQWFSSATTPNPDGTDLILGYVPNAAAQGLIGVGPWTPPPPPPPPPPIGQTSSPEESVQYFTSVTGTYQKQLNDKF
eukprot:1419741-Amphidinium_carterae.2